MLPSVLQPSATDHIPVLADEVRQLLAIEPGESVVDATFGAGGHAALLAADLRGEGRLIALTTGRGEVTGKLLLGDAIDRAALRLMQMRNRDLRERDAQVVGHLVDEDAVAFDSPLNGDARTMSAAPRGTPHRRCGRC